MYYLIGAVLRSDEVHIGGYVTHEDYSIGKGDVYSIIKVITTLFCNLFNVPTAKYSIIQLVTGRQKSNRPSL